METAAQNLKTELEYKLEEIQASSNDPLIFAEAAVMIILQSVEKLKILCKKHKFQNQEQEIHFFKEIKPSFTSKLIYYNEIYSIETNCPFGGTHTLRNYYKAQIVKLEEFYENNEDFYRYYRKGNNLLDHKYFLRGQQDIKLNLDSLCWQADPKFATSHDFKVAQIRANDLLKVYLETRMNNYKQKAAVSYNKNGETPLKWTGSKVGLIELIYALHTEGAFNYGSADLQLMIRFCEKAFDIDLGQFHRTFFEISSRKSERTKFLRDLQEKLIRRMEQKEGI